MVLCDHPHHSSSLVHWCRVHDCNHDLFLDLVWPSYRAKLVLLPPANCTGDQPSSSRAAGQTSGSSSTAAQLAGSLPWKELPNDVKLAILSHLPLRDLARAGTDNSCQPAHPATCPEEACLPHPWYAGLACS